MKIFYICYSIVIVFFISLVLFSISFLISADPIIKKVFLIVMAVSAASVVIIIVLIGLIGLFSPKREVKPATTENIRHALMPPFEGYHFVPEIAFQEESNCIRATLTFEYTKETEEILETLFFTDSHDVDRYNEKFFKEFYKLEKPTEEDKEQIRSEIFRQEFMYFLYLDLSETSLEKGIEGFRKGESHLIESEDGASYSITYIFDLKDVDVATT